MRFHVMTLFPELIENYVSSGIIGKARKNGLIDVTAVNFRAYSKDKHGHVDDYPYGGGAGMLLKAEPVVDCFRDLSKSMSGKARVLYMSPQGRAFDQEMAKELAKEEDLILLCGHYEGLDERALTLLEAEEVSVGDYVLTGGELPALILIDAVSRMIPGVLAENSAEEESFYSGLLEYPQYTRPEEYEGLRVPEVLLSGHHENVEKWRREQSIKRTYEKRPDLLEEARKSFSKEDKAYLKKLEAGEEDTICGVRSTISSGLRLPLLWMQVLEKLECISTDEK